MSRFLCISQSVGEVKNWPAYLRKLLKNFGDSLALKEREARAQACIEQVAIIKAMAGAGTGSDSTKTPSEELPLSFMIAHSLEFVFALSSC